jgi:phospholipase/lecithinase/hemolysin
MKITAPFLVIAAALLAWAKPSLAQPFNQVIVFGDSNIDSGFYKALPNPGGNPTFNADWPTAVAHGAGAPTTNPGLMNSQVLAAFFGLTANPSNTTGGTNYATSGAKNKTVNNVQTGGFTQAVPTVTQIANYLAANGGSANAQALYLIHSGDNDVSYANHDTGTVWPPDPNAYVTQAANDLASAILSLKNAGAQSIVVNGLAYDFPLNDPNKRALKLLYTNTLWSQLNTLGVPFFKGDIDKVRVAINANPGKYGFTTVSTASPGCTQPSGITTAWGLLCSSDPAAPSTYVSANAPQTNLFADDQHLGTAGQKLVGNYLFRLIVPQSVTHDFGGDGKSDIAWRDGSGNTAIWLMSGGQIVQAGGLGNVPATWSIVGQRDFNGDGKFDWLWRDNNGNTAIWLLNGLQILQTGGLGNIPIAWSVAGTGDFNGDGNGDILWRDTSGNTAIWLMNGLQIFQSGGLGNIPGTWTIAGTADFNGDTNADILWRDTSGNTAIWLMNGLQIAQAGGLGNIPLSWSVVGTGDFNGDGNWDILWRDSSGNTAIWLMNGLQILQTGGLGQIPTTWSVAQTGDYNGDGKTDILWRDTSGNTAIWFMNGLQIGSTAGLGNIPTTWTVQGMNVD